MKFEAFKSGVFRQQYQYKSFLPAMAELAACSSRSIWSVTNCCISPRYIYQRTWKNTVASIMMP